MTMYEYIKKMSMEEMQKFIYWVYLNGVEDGKDDCMDSVMGYFGYYMLRSNADNVMADFARYMNNTDK